MISAADILGSINTKLVEHWPSRTVYRQAAPKNFTRPSFLLEAVKETRSRANEGLYRISSFFTVTVFEAVDDYLRSEAAELLQTQIDVMELLSSGKLEVEGRCIDISASFGGNNEGEAYVDLQCDYYDARTRTESELPIMGSVHTTIDMED